MARRGRRWWPARERACRAHQRAGAHLAFVHRVLLERPPRQRLDLVYHVHVILRDQAEGPPLAPGTCGTADAAVSVASGRGGRAHVGGGGGWRRPGAVNDEAVTTFTVAMFWW